MEISEKLVDVHVVAKGEIARTAANERMAEIFDQVDFVISATNPDTAFPAHVMINTRVGDRKVDPATTAPSPSPPTSPATRRCPSRSNRSTACRWACRSWAATTRTSSSSTWRFMVERTAPWALVAPGAPC